MKNVIAGYRTMLGKTQREMAKHLDISLQSYYMKENQKTSFSDKEKLMMKDLFSEINPSVTIDEIFFDNFTKECKEKYKGGE